MARKQRISDGLVFEAEQLVGTTKDIRILRRALSVLLPGLLGVSLPMVGRLIGRSRSSVVRYQHEFRKRIDGVQAGNRTWGGRRHAYLSCEEEERFLATFLHTASEGGVLIVAEVKAAFEERVGHSVAESTIYRLLDRHGWRTIVPRRRHPKADPKTQEEFTKDSKRK